MIGCPELATDPRFENQAAWIENNNALILILEEAFARRDYAEWVTLLDDNRFTYGDVRQIDDIPSDPQMIEGRAIRAIDDPAAGAEYVVDTPIWVEDSYKADPTMPPELGQHTEEVLRDIGYDDASLAELKEAGAIP